MIFGQLTDITGSSTIAISDVANTDELKIKLYSLYPRLAEYPCLIAVEKEIISTNTALSDNFTVALLPPFAGG